MRGNIDSGYVDELLGSMNLSLDLTALDVGCGSGFVAIPMAKRVRWVTALDQAPNMLDLTREYAAAADVRNLTTINKDWLQVEIGRDVELHDIVLASRCLQTTELRRFLLQMDKAAQKQCFVAWGAGAREDDAEICHVLDIEYKPHPSYVVVFNLLFEMGILANVEIHSRPITRWYRDVDEAVFSLLRGRPMEEPRIETLKTYYQKRLTFREGRYWRVIREPWALISWKKGN
jgi:SAM-dependent methyltransferase